MNFILMHIICHFLILHGYLLVLGMQLNVASQASSEPISADSASHVYNVIYC